MNAKYRSSESSSDQSASFALGYLLRVVEEEINRIGNETGESATPAELAFRLGSILQTKARGKLLDSTEHLPNERMRRKTSKRHEKRFTKKALHVRSHGRGSLKMYSKMEHRIRVGKDPKLKEEAVEWFKQNHPNSSVIKRAA